MSKYPEDFALEEIKRDALRYRWLADNPHRVAIKVDPEGTIFHTDFRTESLGETIDELRGKP